MKDEERVLDLLLSNLANKSRGTTRQSVSEKYIILASTALRRQTGIGFSHKKDKYASQYDTVDGCKYGLQSTSYRRTSFTK